MYAPVNTLLYKSGGFKEDRIIQICFRDDIAKLCISVLQSTLVISNSKGLSEILRDIRTSTYQICRIGEFD